MKDNIHISVVTPAYKCSASIEELHRRLKNSLSEITGDFEIIFVDDCSPQDDWRTIEEICRRDPKVRGVKLSRNYGQHFAITAGLDRARGEWVVVMDCDLQDQPEEIIKLYAKAQEGWSIVVGRRASRKDSAYRRIASYVFGTIYSWLGDIKSDSSISNFSISSRRVIETVCRFRERNRSFPMFLAEVGFARTTIDIEHAPRHAGNSSYSFFKLSDFAVQSIVARSNKPLRLSIFFGMLLSIGSTTYATFLILRYFFSASSVPGWTSLAVLISFLGGLGFANLGIIGLYLGKVFDETKARPLYVVEEEIGPE
jgi:glycosyltransferase involved in cell wall biosynthesis